MRKQFIASIFFILLCFISFTQNVTLIGPTTCNGSAVTGSWTVPCGVTSITIEIYGGGGGAGGGGGGSNGGLFNTRGGGGGGGGAYSTATISVVSGAVYTYSIGAGGCGGSNGGDGSSGGNGTAGGNTSFNGTDANNIAVNLLANGGARGTGGSGSNGNTGTGGAGGIATGGSSNLNGTAGLNGNGATGGIGGTGAGTVGGAGGATTGAAGLIYGGGGAGGGDGQGGRGASGGIIITYNGTLSIPATPLIMSNPATCLTNSSSTISNYDATMTYVFTPAGPTVSAGGLINGMTVSTNYTVVANDGSCSSLASASFSNTGPSAAPSIPTITTTPPTCSTDGSSSISNYNSSLSYTFTPSGPIINNGNISGMTIGTSYTIIANDGSCDSSPSSAFSNLTMLASPETPNITSIPASCISEGESEINNYNVSNTYIFSPTGPTVNSSGEISGMIVGTNYTVIANDGTCNSIQSANFSNSANVPPPPAPTIATISPTCTADGVSTIGNYNLNFTYQFSPVGPTVSTAGIILNMTAGTSYTVVANDGSCNSIASTAFSNGEQLPAPIPEITGDLTYCTGSNTTLTASGGTSYSWSSGTTAVIGTNASITLTQGIYTLTATNANGCSATINTIVSEVSLPPAPQLTASPVNCPGDVLTLSSEIELGNQIVWSGPNGFSSNEIEVTLPISNNDVGVYQAYQYSSPTCLSTISTINIQINNVYSFDDFNFPNVITANNDGINDVLDIENIYKTCDTFSIYFFNRWGTLVYDHKLGETPFSGKDANGNELADGTYFYKLEFYSGGEQQTITKSGFIQLLR